MRTMTFKEANCIFITRDGLEALAFVPDLVDFTPQILFRFLHPVYPPFSETSLEAPPGQTIQTRQYALRSVRRGQLPVYVEV